MSTNGTYTLYPELHDLRKTLAHLQEQFSASKPLLNIALRELIPTKRTTTLDLLGTRLVSPLEAMPSAILQQQYAAAQQAAAALDLFLSNPQHVSDLANGGDAAPLTRIFETTIRDLLDTLASMGSQLLESNYGAAQITLQHDYERMVDITVVSINGAFEALDILPGNLEPLSPIAQFLEAMEPRIRLLDDRETLQPLWKMLSYWLQRWEPRTDYASRISKWFDGASIDLQRARNIDQYRAGEMIATLTLRSGKVASVQVSKGRLPAGLRLHAQGHIVVDDPARLIPGYFEGLELSGSTDLGASFQLAVPEIVIGHDVEAVYVVVPPVDVLTMENGQILAYPEDVDGVIVEAQVAAGKFPTGVRFNTVTGTLSVANASRLQDGIYPLTVVTLDALGGSTEHEFELTIGLGESSRDDAAQKVVVELLNLPLPLQLGDELAKLQKDGEDLSNVETVNSSLPMGLALSQNGSILVVTNDQPAAGRYHFQAKGKDKNQQNYSLSVTLELVASKEIAPVNVIYVQLPDLQLPQTESRLITVLEANSSPLVACKLMSGDLPPGADIDDLGGFTIVDPDALRAGTYAFALQASAKNGLDYLIHVGIKLLKGVALPQSEDEIIAVSFFEVLPLQEAEIVADLNFDQRNLLSATVVFSKITPGLYLDDQGLVLVGDAKALEPGKSDFIVRLEDRQGNRQLYKVYLQFIDLAEFKPSRERVVLEMLPLQLPVKTGHIVGKIVDSKVELLQADVFGGIIPAGIELTKEGVLAVTKPEALSLGKFAAMLQVSTSAQSYELELRLQVKGSERLPGQLEAYYAEFLGNLYPPKIGKVIGRIEAAGVKFNPLSHASGDLPDGIVVEKDGRLLVKSVDSLRPAVYEFEVVSRGLKGPNAQVLVRLELLDIKTFETLVVPLGEIEIPQKAGAQVAALTYKGMHFTGVKHAAGTFPTGLTLYANGQLRVDDPKNIRPGKYEFTTFGKWRDQQYYAVVVSLELQNTFRFK